MKIEPSEFPGVGIPAAGVETVGTTAYLAARTDAPAELVRAVLEALYREPELCVGLIPRSQAAESQGLAFASGSKSDTLNSYRQQYALQNRQWISFRFQGAAGHSQSVGCVQRSPYVMCCHFPIQ